MVTSPRRNDCSLKRIMERMDRLEDAKLSSKIKENIEKYGMDLIRIDGCKVEKVIVIRYIRGVGNEKDPVQVINEYRTLEGDLLAKVPV